MIELNKNTEEHIYDMYLHKNQVIMGSGYEVPKRELFSPGKYELLEDGNKPLLFFSKGYTRLSQNTFFSNLLLFDESLFAQAQQSIAQYLACNSVNPFVFAVEDYLSTELSLVNQLNVELDHVSVRMINHNIRKVPALPPCENVAIESFAVGKDESRFVDIFNKTFVGLCQPTTINEVTKWTRSPGFSPDYYLFAVEDGITVGFIAIEADLRNETSYLQEIGVIQEERGKGIADWLMYSGFTSVLAKGISKMGVGFLEQNEAAGKFFSKWGFQKLYRRIFVRRQP